MITIGVDAHKQVHVALAGERLYQGRGSAGAISDGFPVLAVSPNTAPAALTASRSDGSFSTVSTLVSHPSQYTTLFSGNLIFTGTSGETKAISPGDLVEVETSGIGVLKNTVVMERG